MTERATILKIDSEIPAAPKTPSGYAAVPREVTRREDLSAQAHRVLTALIGLCRGDDRQTAASIRMICVASGMPRRSVQRYVGELVEKKLIRRRPIPGRPGGPMATQVLCHPDGPSFSNIPRANYGATPRQLRRDPAPTTARPRANVGAPRLTDRLTDSLTGGEPPVAPTPAGNPTPWDSRQQEVIALATQRWGACYGDFIVGDLLRSYPAEMVMAAIDRHWAKVGPSLKPALLMATCRGMLADGWKPEQPEQRKTGGEVPYKTQGPVPPPVTPMTEEEREEFKAEGKRLRDQYRERMRNGRRQKQEE